VIFLCSGFFSNIRRIVKAKVNLLIILTPHIVESKEDFARILKRKMEERDEFARKFYGNHVSFEDNIYLDKKRGALLTVVKEVDDSNRKEEEELLRRKSKKDEKSIMVTPEGGQEVIPIPEGSFDREDALVPEAVPELDGE
jgi:general secretion pathway protein D